MNKLQLGNKLPKSLKLPKGVKGIKPLQVALIVIVVALVALIGYFSASYFQVANSKDKLEKDKQQKELQLQKMPLKNISALKSEFDAINESFKKKAPFPTSIDNVEEVAYQVMQAARDAKIISSLQYAPEIGLTDTVLGSNTYAVQAYQLTASNDIKNVINFLSNLEDLHETIHMPYDAFRIEGLTLTNSSNKDTITGKYVWDFSLKLEVILQKQP